MPLRGACCVPGSFDVRPQMAMENVIKIALASVGTLVAGSGFLAAGGGALSRGFFYLSKFSTVAIRQQESPVVFYAYVVFMLFWGVLLLAAGVAFGLSRGQLRKAIISFVDSAVLSRPSPRWSFIVLAVLFVALFACMALYVL